MCVPYALSVARAGGEAASTSHKGSALGAAVPPPDPRAGKRYLPKGSALGAAVPPPDPRAGKRYLPKGSALGAAVPPPDPRAGKRYLPNRKADQVRNVA